MQPHNFALEWMYDFEEFQAALASHSDTRDSGRTDIYEQSNGQYEAMNLVLDESSQGK